MRILVVGTGVIGSVYAGKLLQAGHQVDVLARGTRLRDLRTHGLLLQDAQSGERIAMPVPSLSEPAVDARYDVVFVPVRSEQVESTLPILVALRADSDDSDGPDVVFFGNTAGQQADLTAALGGRALFGFPAVGGVIEGPVIRYVLIRQQNTMLGEPGGATTPRLRQLQDVLVGAGFPTRISADINDWMMGHSAFVVPIGFALYRVGTDTAELAADAATVTLMVRATREAFRALGADGNTEIPTNLRFLYLWTPTAFVVLYWRRVMASPRGELWFGAHSRAAPEEMRALAAELRAALRVIARPIPNLEELLAPLDDT
jgi:2-dehydropantoate 2-reductase